MRKRLWSTFNNLLELQILSHYDRISTPKIKRNAWMMLIVPSLSKHFGILHLERMIWHIVYSVFLPYITCKSRLQHHVVSFRHFSTRFHILIPSNCRSNSVWIARLAFYVGRVCRRKSTSRVNIQHNKEKVHKKNSKLQIQGIAKRINNRVIIFLIPLKS